MNLRDFDTLLQNGYPAPEDLNKFPLRERLQELDLRAWTTTARVIKLLPDEPNMEKSELEKRLRERNQILENEGLGEVYRQHIKKVMNAIFMLLRPGREMEFGFVDNVKDSAYKDYFREASPFKEYGKFLESLGDDLRRLLRFVALYHDIGKVVHRDRHPMLGRHLLESLSDESTRQFKELLRSDGKDWFYLMVQMVGHHDLFGVLCTGEASRPVLIDALRLKDASIAIGCLTTLNLADIRGTLPYVSIDILRTVLSDWKFMTDLLAKTGSSEELVYRSDFERQILRDAQEQENTANRIQRLLVTLIFMLRNITPDEQRILAEKVTSDIVLDALKNRLGPEMLVFCYDFALVCKLDYTLRFLVSLFTKWIDREKSKVSQGENTEGLEWIKSVDLKGIAAIITEILVRLVTNYRDLTRQREGWPRRIGIELLGLTRADEISNRVIDLLLSDRRTEGVNWIADEATAWYFI